jgi:hypothetical protein
MGRVGITAPYRGGGGTRKRPGRGRCEQGTRVDVMELPPGKHLILFAPPGGYRRILSRSSAATLMNASNSIPTIRSYRGSIPFSWPEGTAECFDAAGRWFQTAKDLENRNWTLAQAARFQLGIAMRQCCAIGFACDSEHELSELADIAEREFPTLQQLQEEGAAGS